MAFWGWVSQDWFNLITSAGIIGSLWFTAVSLRSETKTRQVANLLTITENYREIWKEFLNEPKLARVLDAKADMRKKPVTADEEIFVNLIIFNISNYYYAVKDDMVVNLEGLRRDVAQFFSRPVAQAVWEKTKVMQNDDFVRFVESCRNWK
jgi:hypothetical protein